MFNRRFLLSRLSLLGAGSVGAGLIGTGYATAIEPHAVRVTRYRVTPPRWPDRVQLRVAILTDLHAHPRNMSEAELETVVARTNALEPDVAVLLGDYGSQSAGPVPPEAIARIMRGLTAPKGIYAVQGNHDWSDDKVAFRQGYGPTRVERAFRAAGIRLIENEAVAIEGSRPL